MLWFFLFLTLLTPLESEFRQPPETEIIVSVEMSDSSEQRTDAGPCEGGSNWFDENPTR